MSEVTKSQETIIDGVDLSKLSVDQLIALSEEEWKEFYAVVEAALKAKAEDSLSKLKAKAAAIIAAWKTYALPVIKYGAGAYVVLKLAGVI
jgi:hypothetical protein